VTVLQVPSLLFEEPGEPRNLLIVDGNQPLSDALDAVQFAVAVVLIVATWIIIARRERARPRDRAWRPVLWTGGLAGAGFLLAKGFDAAGSPSDALDLLSQALVATVPFGFLAGLLRSRLAQGQAVTELIERVGQAPDEGALRAALADALGDPSVALAYWLPESGRYVDALGRPVTESGAGWTEVDVGGRRVAAIAHDPALDDEPQLVRAAGAAAALALENQRLEAELRARIEELRTSRARLVEAGDTARRRLERDLHDGAQSRLVAVMLKLRLAQMKVEGPPEAAELLDEAGADLRASLEELRELARGIHPAILTDRGLEAAVRALAERSPVPVTLSVDDVPRAVEAAIYFVVAEGLTNVAKYARATSAAVTVRRAASAVAVEIADDGVGGADMAAGSGLSGLSDRVGALDGRVWVESPPGEGTSLRAEIPC
jgi:signal transduction histidine kinase